MLISLLFLSQNALAVPVQMNHQGRLKDATGVGITGTHFLTFKIYTETSGGTALWQESLTVDFNDGYYSTDIGINGTLDSELLNQHPLYMELALDTNPPMSPRYALGSVPYSVVAETAESVQGPVDATEISVNGTVIIDADGNWVGPEIAGTGSSTGGSSTGGSSTGGSTTGGSSTGGTSGGTNSPVYWSDILGRPLGLDDGDDYLTEGEVETYITNGFINLATGSRMGGFDLLTTNSTITPQWSNIQGIPSDIADGDQDTQLSESQVENYIINGAINLGSGSQAGGSTILTQGDSISWSSLNNVPVGLDDGDDDTLSGLNCGSGDVVSWNGTAFECLTPQQTSVSGTVVDLASGSTINGSPIVTEADLSGPSATNWNDVVDVPAGFLDGVDDDSFADITCGSGETISFDGSDWVCVSSTIDFADIANVPADLVDGDNDTLGVLQCTEGQVAVYSEADSGWICGEGGGASGELAKSNRIGESDGGEAYTNLDTNPPAVIPDDNTFGFTSARYVADTHTISTLSIDLDIEHTNMGEITAILTAPSGTSITIYDGDHEGQENFNGNLGWDYSINGGDLYSFFGEDTVGTWTLKVTDNAGADDDGNTNTGVLNGWTMRFNEDWDGDIFVGDNVTVQEKIETSGELMVSYGGDFVMTNTDGNETFRIDGESGKITEGTIDWSSLSNIPNGLEGTADTSEGTEFVAKMMWVNSEYTYNINSGCYWNSDYYEKSCPSGSSFISGRCESSSTDTDYGWQTNAIYNDNRWRCRKHHCNQSGQNTITVWALCLKH